MCAPYMHFSAFALNARTSLRMLMCPSAPFFIGVCLLRGGSFQRAKLVSPALSVFVIGQ